MAIEREKENAYVEVTAKTVNEAITQAACAPDPDVDTLLSEQQMIC